MDRSKWRKLIKDVWWPGWVWVGECFFWYRPTRVIPDQRPLNGCVCVYTDEYALMLLVGWQEGHPACKNWVVGCWHGYLSGARCRLAYSPADTLPLIVCCFSKIQIGFTFLVPAHPGSPGQRAIKRVCVCVLMLYLWDAVAYCGWQYL